MTIQNYSQAAENNRAPILEQLTILFDREGVVLEIGSGSGQHALAFSKYLPHLTWQPADQGEYFSGLLANIAAAGAKMYCYLFIWMCRNSGRKPAMTTLTQRTFYTSCRTS